MTLYHVRLSVAGDRSDETKLDLTRDQLMEQFVEPYRRGDSITVNGRTVEIDNVERIRVSSSERSARDFIPGLKERDRSSSVAVIGGPSYSWRAAAAATNVTDEFINGPPGAEAETPGGGEVRARSNRLTVPSGPGDRRSVFLVRGRDDAVAEALTAFLRSLDLKVIEWEEAVALTGEPNPYIGDVINAGLDEADAVVVLCTPDDLARLDPQLADSDEDPALLEKGQPRQNVLYEAGMAMALAPRRTLIVATPGTRIMSDIEGRHLAYLDDSPQARRRLVGRLQNTGLAVDDGGEAWLTAGSFSR